jgi:two-component system, response regulator RpfG
VAIPLEARLVAVADVFDALTSDRPYRRAWAMDRVVAHMRDGAGSHFDPAIVDAFLRVAIAGDTGGVRESD